VCFGRDECALQEPPSRPLVKHGCGFEDRGNDRRITRAPADMAGKHVADLLLVRLGRVPQKMRPGTQYAGSAGSDMRGVMVCEGALYLAQGIGFSESLHRHDVRTVYLGRILRAAAHRSPIDQNCTRSAHAVLTTDMHPEGLQFMTQKITEQHARLGLAASGLPVQG